MPEAVIVATARTLNFVAFKGSLNNLKPPGLPAHAIRHAVECSGINPAKIGDVALGKVLTAGTAGINIARLSALAIKLPFSAAAQTIDRRCASGLMVIGTAAAQITQCDMDATGLL